MPDLELLRRHEPVVRFTRGELFFPTAVEPYVSRCSLWSFGAEDGARCVAPAASLDLDRLAREGTADHGGPLSLRFVQAPLSRSEYRRWRRAPRDRLGSSARFTTTGMFGRLVDAGFQASLLLRGKVAAGLASAAHIAYREHLEADRFTYYGRVVREGGYVCLQYWLFYAMNDWRSTFSGVNDHEADWELVAVYLAEEGEEPAWVAASSHDHQGAELRRRWDDPELERDGDHPVVYAGAGSHSGAFRPGDYVISVNPPGLQRAIGLVRRVQRLLAPWRDETRTMAGFGIPFVDYARGDGLVVGPGAGVGWTAIPVDDETPWVQGFRGLWGLDTEDRFGGERAPAGPRYERDGSVRRAWADPLGWAGLLGVATRDEEVAELLAERVAWLEREIGELDEAIGVDGRRLRSVRAEASSLATRDHARALAGARAAEAAERETSIGRLIAARSDLSEELRAHRDTLADTPAREPPQAHLTGPRGPHVEEQERRLRFLRLWSVVSTPLVFAAAVVALNATPLGRVTTVLAVLGAFIGVEAFARRRFFSFLASVALLAGALAIGAIVVGLFREQWRLAVSLPLAAAALALLVGNLRDLHHGWRRG